MQYAPDRGDEEHDRNRGGQHIDNRRERTQLDQRRKDEGRERIHQCRSVSDVDVHVRAVLGGGCANPVVLPHAQREAPPDEDQSGGDHHGDGVGADQVGEIGGVHVVNVTAACEFGHLAHSEQ